MNKEGMKQLDLVGACSQAREWAKDVKDLKTAWATCPRSDWMIWALHRIDFKDERKFRLCACQCVRETPLADGRTLWDLLTDERSRNAVEVAERFAEGKATDDERSVAYAYAYADVATGYLAGDAATYTYFYAVAATAAYASAATHAAATYAASAATYAAASADADAAAAAAGAADAAADAAYAAGAASYTAGAAAARKNARAWQANLLRQWISWDEVERVLKAYKKERKA